jgi:hypothetical protein
MINIILQFFLIQVAVGILTLIMWHKEFTRMYSTGQRNWFKLLLVQNQLILTLIILAIHNALLYAGV